MPHEFRFKVGGRGGHDIVEALTFFVFRRGTVLYATPYVSKLTVYNDICLAFKKKVKYILVIKEKFYF